MRTPGTPQELLRRRKRAMALFDKGMTGREVAERVGVTQPTVWKWRKAHRERGEEALTVKPIPGRPPRLSLEQRRDLIDLIAQGAVAHRWPTDLWTTQRIADLIARHFGVRYHRDHVSRLLRKMGLSWKRPVRRAAQRDEERIARWVAEDVPRIKKKRRR